MNDRSQDEFANIDNDVDRLDDVVDPRVQIELERLNTATDDINKLEVDLDEARATFRELLCESTFKINTLAKKLSACIEKSRPYYDARFKAKETLTETQKASLRFEKANSQHAAAKEMVYLAEEGLRAEGRCFDHAWQEMLNHATSRVNESEHERAICEVEHKRTTALYHKAEHDVQILQQELKRSIAKSRPYYEMKAHFNQVLEEQKLRVSAFEKSVADAKMTYADALRNLERISDEIHRTRQYDSTNNYSKQVEDITHTSFNPSKTSSTESSSTESPDSTAYVSDEYLQLPEKLNLNTVSALSKEQKNSSEYLGTIIMSSTEPRRYIKRNRSFSIASIGAKHFTFVQNQAIASTSNLSDIATVVSPTEKKVKIQSPKIEKEGNEIQISEEWTEISLNTSPEEVYYNNVYSDDEDQIPYQTLEMNLSSELLNIVSDSNESVKCKEFTTHKSLSTMIKKNEISLSEEKRAQVVRSPSFRRKGKLDNCLATWISRNSITDEMSAGSSVNSSRRQSIDVLWNFGTGERVKELLNQGMMMLNISNLTERRSSEPKVMNKPKDNSKIEKIDKIELKSKKLPNPLEKTINYLNTEEETSDNESLASVEMLTEDQISSLMMESDMNQVCQEILGTPLVEVCPLLQQIQQQKPYL